jgi:large subunit ribosomal protein L29
MIKTSEVRGKSDAELDYELENRQKELFDLRFRSATETTNNPSRIGNLRREIARIKTVLHERARGIRGQERK